MTNVTHTPNALVVESIKEAVQVANSVYASLRSAAAFAAVELDISKPLREAVKEVRDNYSEYFDGDHNLQAVFSDFLTLHYAYDTPVSIERKRGKGEVEEVHTTANEAIHLSKHDMREAAREVRAANGAGRKEGGGRTPRTPAAKGSPAKNLTTSAKSCIENLLKSDAGVQALREILKEQGYRLSKVSK